jgi:hypothetical protein
MFAQMFPCLPHLETLAFIVETKLLPGEQKYFLPNSEKFDETYTYDKYLCATMFPSLSRALRDIYINS